MTINLQGKLYLWSHTPLFHVGQRVLVRDDILHVINDYPFGKQGNKITLNMSQFCGVFVTISEIGQGIKADGIFYTIEEDEREYIWHHWMFDLSYIMRETKKVIKDILE